MISHPDSFCSGSSVTEHVFWFKQRQQKLHVTINLAQTAQYIHKQWTIWETTNQKKNGRHNLVAFHFLHPVLVHSQTKNIHVIFTDLSFEVEKMYLHQVKRRLQGIRYTTRSFSGRPKWKKPNPEKARSNEKKSGKIKKFFCSINQKQ